MSRDRSASVRVREFGKTYSIRSRFLATVISAMLAITVFIGGLSIYEVDAYIQETSQSFVGVTCDNEGERINNSLRNMEKSVKIMEGYLLELFGSEEVLADRDLQAKAFESADRMFGDVVKHTSTLGAVSYYFRLDPAISDNKAGLFYSKPSVDSEFMLFEPTDLSLYDRNDTEHVGWFWEPYEAGHPVWMRPYHNKNNGILMISYVIPMYYGDRFIGIVGMDFDYMTLEDQVRGISVYEEGYAHLEMDGTVISADKTAPDPDEYLSVSRELVNGMTLVLSASYDDIRQIRYEIGFKILLIVVVLFALFTALVAYAVKRIADPLKKLTDAAARMADGDYDMEVEQSEAREIRLLGAAFENMARRLREREKLLHLSANRDSMTGLRNTTSYAAWVTQFDKEIEKGQVDFGIAMLDLNDLKRMNDVQGHEMGNRLIVTAAALISEVFKESLVFRIGGDEFLVVLQNASLENADELLALLRARCRDTYVPGSQEPIGIAIGFSRFEHGRDLQFADVFRRADCAMYENKRDMKGEG